MKQQERINLKRREFREKYASLAFNSYLNLALVVLIFAASLFYSFVKIQWDMLAIALVPLGIFYGEGVLYIAHRFQQHKKRKHQEAIFEIHTIWHHGMFSSKNMQIDSIKDMNMVVLPYFIYGFVLGAIYLPLAFLSEIIFTSDIGWILLFSIVLQLIWYELIHTLSHLDNPPFLKKLAHHHRVHHNPKLMGKYNFGIGSTVFDKMFGTYHAPEWDER